MPFFDTIASWFNRHRGFLIGKVVLTLAVGALTLMHVPLIAAAAVVVGGSFAITAYSRLSEQSAYEQDMVNLYREDIATELGKNPADITRADLREAAKTNDVVDQALARQHRKTILALGTAALSSAVTFGLVVFFGATSALKGLVEGAVKNTALASVANFIGIGTVSGLSGLVLKDGLKAAIGHRTGVNKAAAHDRILDITRHLSRGQSVTKEQVYAVLVAGDAALEQRITAHFGHGYAALKPSQQTQVLDKIGVSDAVQQLADDINSGTSPGHLAYLIGEDLHHHRREQTPAEAPVKSSFVERLGLAPRHAASHAQQVDAGRSAELALASQR